MPAGAAPRWIDLSHSISPATPAFPGDPPVEITILDATDRTDPDIDGSGGRRHLNCSRLAICVHCGTHLDAPFHFFGDGRTVDQIPLDVCHGPAELIDLPPERHRGLIEPWHLEPHQERMSRSGRVILRTGWDRWWPTPRYFAEHPVLNGAAARLLVECGIVLVGVDFPSVDRPPFPAHLELLGRGVVIVENLTNLGLLDAGTFHFSALPLPLAGRDGSPVRAVAWVDEANAT